MAPQSRQPALDLLENFQRHRGPLSFALSIAHEPGKTLFLKRRPVVFRLCPRQPPARWASHKRKAPPERGSTLVAFMNEYNQLQRRGLSTFFPVGGRAVMGATLSAAGTSWLHTRHAQRMLKVIQKLDPQIDEPRFGCDWFEQSGKTYPASPIFEWAMNHCDLCLIETTALVKVNSVISPPASSSALAPSARIRRRASSLDRCGSPAMSAIRSLSGVNRTWRGMPISVENESADG
jgi:hypothetical protein